MFWGNSVDDATSESFLMRLLNRPGVLSPTHALLKGIAWLIVGVIMGWYFNLIPSSVISFTWADVRLMWHLALALVSWISSTVLLFAVAALLNRRVVISELFGRMLYAHWPVLLLMLPGITDDKVAYATFMQSPETAFSTHTLYASCMSLMCVVILLWYLYWGYVAFRRSVMRSNIVVVVLYAMAMLISWYMSNVALDAVYAGLVK